MIQQDFLFGLIKTDIVRQKHIWFSQILLLAKLFRNILTFSEHERFAWKHRKSTI